MAPIDDTKDYTYDIIHPDDLDPEPAPVSGVERTDLTRPLGCMELAARIWYLDPGEAIAHHKHERQEEFYYLVEGDGRMKIAGEKMDIPEGSVIRLPPETPRQVFNDTDHRHEWLIIAAPRIDNDGTIITEDE